MLPEQGNGKCDAQHCAQSIADIVEHAERAAVEYEHKDEQRQADQRHDGDSQGQPGNGEIGSMTWMHELSRQGMLPLGHEEQENTTAMPSSMSANAHSAGLSLPPRSPDG